MLKNSLVNNKKKLHDKDDLWKLDYIHISLTSSAESANIWLIKHFNDFFKILMQVHV